MNWISKVSLGALLLILLLTLTCRGTPAPIPSAPSATPPPPSGPVTGLVAFSSNLHSGQECHRDALEGIDLFIGQIDLHTGRITDVRLVDGGPGHQWFPALAPDGRTLAYNESLADQESIILMDLTTLEKQTLVAGGRYPVFSANGQVLYYSRRPTGSIYAYDLTTGQTTEIHTAHPSGDPFPVSERFLVYHSRPGGTGQAFPVVYDLTTGGETDFRCPGCGHLVGNPAGDRIVGSEHSNTHVWVSRWEVRAGRWSPFNLLIDDAQAEITASISDFQAATHIILSYAAWPLADRLLITAQSAEPVPDSNLLRTTGAQLMLLDIAASPPRFTPVILADYAAAPFPIQTLGGVVLPDQGMNGLAGTTYTLSGDNPTESRPLLYILIHTRTKDPDYPGSADFVQDLPAYREYRQGLLELARRLEALQVPWSLQTDWNLLEGVLQHEVRNPDATLLAETDGLNVIQYLAQHGVEIAPHSHETYGYNYADVAYLIQQCGVTPAPVVGGHIYEGGESFQNWPRFIEGIQGQKYSDLAFWQPSILTGAATYLHRDDPLVTGVWRPKSVDEFFTHDPNGSLISIGEWSFELRRQLQLLANIQQGRLPAGRMYTAALGINSYALSKEGYLGQLIQERIEPLLQMQADGIVQFLHYADVPQVWQEQFGAVDSVHCEP